MPLVLLDLRVCRRLEGKRKPYEDCNSLGDDNGNFPETGSRKQEEKIMTMSRRRQGVAGGSNTAQTVKCLTNLVQVNRGGSNEHKKETTLQQLWETIQNNKRWTNATLLDDGDVSFVFASATIA
jgi:hypothetical protein